MGPLAARSEAQRPILKLAVRERAQCLGGAFWGGPGGWVPLSFVAVHRYGSSMTNIDEWWPKLPESARVALSADPRAPLSAASVIAITGARGFGPVGAAWEGRQPDFHLTHEEAAWIEGQAGDVISAAVDPG